MIWGQQKISVLKEKLKSGRKKPDTSISAKNFKEQQD